MDHDGLGRHRHLVEGLVGDEHLTRYRTSPMFCASIDTLAGMLPHMIDGLAAYTDDLDVKHAAAIETAMNAPVVSIQDVLRSHGLTREEFEGNWTPKEKPDEEDLDSVRPRPGDEPASRVERGDPRM